MLDCNRYRVMTENSSLARYRTGEYNDNNNLYSLLAISLRITPPSKPGTLTDYQHVHILKDKGE